MKVSERKEIVEELIKQLEERKFELKDIKLIFNRGYDTLRKRLKTRKKEIFYTSEEIET